MILDKVLEFGLKDRNIHLYSTFKWSDKHLIFNYKIFKKQLLFIKKFKKSYFIKYSIKDIPKSCCTLDYKIIDFDETKDIICKETNQITRKSCDGLCLNKSIDFIEFKSLNNFFDKEFKYKLKSNKEYINESQIIINKVKDFNFNKKIRDSLWLFDYIINHHALKLNNSEQEYIYNNIKKNYFIVKDNYQPLINLALQFNTLGKLSNNKLSNRETMDVYINKELEEITVINKPQLIDCNELKKYLEENR